MNDFRITEMDRYLFGAGTHYEIYNKMGAHLACENGTDGRLMPDRSALSEILMPGFRDAIRCFVSITAEFTIFLFPA